MNALEFNGIRRAYTKGNNVLDGVSFSIEPGQVVGLLGKNGAGKTTLIRIAMGMIEPQEGTARVLGMDPRGDAVEVKRRVGYVAEDQILPPFLTIERVLDLHRQLYPNWDDEMAASLVERFELPATKKIKSLSKGQARRVALLCAVAHRPELLLLDEPASGLDPAARREFLETSIRLLNETGTSILFSSHYMADVERLADRIVMIHDGSVLIDSGLDEIHEGFSLAMLPRANGLDTDRIRALEPCVGVREHPGGFHAILRLAPFEAQAAVEQGLGVAEARCQSIALEDIFVELAGGAS
ncbi:MAG: ABC transporter ATP-binding protein [Acidobacteriota bacterium]|nr:ABC transporter ATP-binding protein [Acidobacteriota bacterium]MDH3786578.1 ABC transporter ATP-binding protein [Acidobacteriota bacterium]